MDFLDYREKLGLAFSDDSKRKFFLAKMFNLLEAIAENPNAMAFNAQEYYDFCCDAGISVDPRCLGNYAGTDRTHHLLAILKRHDNSISQFLLYYITFANSIAAEGDECWTRRDYILAAEQMLTESHVMYDLLEDNGKYFIFPKGVPEMDTALISETLDWLEGYPKTGTAWGKALKEYSNLTDDNASDIADKFRKALETFFREFFSVEKSLENCKKEYGVFLRARGIPGEISSNFETLLQAYTNYMNGYAKHQDRTSKNVLEYLMYQTGNIIRLLITLKQEAENDAD